MSAPDVREAWRMMRAEGLGVDAADRLRDMAIVKSGWTPPIGIADVMTMDIAPCSIPTYEFMFRLQREADGWYVEGQGPTGPWVPVEGPFPELPWLAGAKAL
jgi:hypothetical protein